MAASALSFTGSPCQKSGKAETFYFCLHYQNLVEMILSQKSPDSFQGHTPSSAILLNIQLTDTSQASLVLLLFYVDSPLWMFPILQHLHLAVTVLLSISCSLLMPIVCRDKKRGNLLFREKRCTLCLPPQTGLYVWSPIQEGFASI